MQVLMFSSGLNNANSIKMNKHRKKNVTTIREWIQAVKLNPAVAKLLLLLAHIDNTVATVIGVCSQKTSQKHLKGENNL